MHTANVAWLQTGDMVVSQNRGTQYRTQNTIVLIIGTPKRTLHFGEPPYVESKVKMVFRLSTRRPFFGLMPFMETLSCGLSACRA